MPLISKFVFSTQTSESDLYGCSSAEKQRNLALFFFNLPHPPKSQNYGISACRHTHRPPKVAICYKLWSSPPASLSCIFHTNAEHIVKCKKTIRIDSSWNGAITFQIYKGNETRRFLRDSWFTVRLFYFKDPVSPSVFAPKLFLPFPFPLQTEITY